jgi:hypothetical protein
VRWRSLCSPLLRWRYRRLLSGRGWHCVIWNGGRCCVWDIGSIWMDRDGRCWRSLRGLPIDLRSRLPFLDGMAGGCEWSVFVRAIIFLHNLPTELQTLGICLLSLYLHVQIIELTLTPCWGCLRSGGASRVTFGAMVAEMVAFNCM